MSQNPSSVFGYGVILKYHEYRTDDEQLPGSPGAIYDSGRAYDGVRIVLIGSALGDEELLLITAPQAYSASSYYLPRALPSEKTMLQLEWTRRIEKYIKEWDLEEYLLEGFQEPSFIHAPYYG
jgi:hypothetical protein